METLTAVILFFGLGYLIFRAMRKDPDPVDFRGRSKRLKRYRG